MTRELRRLRFAAALLGAMAFCLGAVAEGYRLTAGDVLSVHVLGEAELPPALVDLDGTVALGGFGRVRIAGQTLAEAEEMLQAAALERGLLLDPQVTLSVRDYAPVLVTGDVAEPGRYPFSPGLTVELAVALAGGATLSGVDRYEMALLRADLAEQVHSAVAALHRLGARAARLRSQIDGTALPDAVAPEGVRRPDRALLTRLLAEEAEVAAAASARRAALMDSWGQALAEHDRQSALLTDRIAVQERLLLALREDVDAAQTLKTRGLETAQGVADARRDLAEGEARLLDFQVALSQSRRAATETARLSADFDGEARRLWLQELQQVRAEIDQRRRDRLAADRKLAAVSESGALGDLLAAELPPLLRLTRADGTRLADVSPALALRPGDAITLQIPAAQGLGQ